MQPILADIWRRWLLCICRIPGRVVRPVEIAGHVQALPVYHTRVHLCAVDSWPLLLSRIPDPILIKIREELLRVWPPIPRPPPEFLAYKSAVAGLESALNGKQGNDPQLMKIPWRAVLKAVGTALVILGNLLIALAT